MYEDWETNNQMKNEFEWDNYEYNELEVKVSTSQEKNKVLSTTAVIFINVCFVLFFTAVFVYCTKIYLKYKRDIARASWVYRCTADYF